MRRSKQLALGLLALVSFFGPFLESCTRLMLGRGLNVRIEAFAGRSSRMLDPNAFERRRFRG